METVMDMIFGITGNDKTIEFAPDEDGTLIVTVTDMSTVEYASEPIKYRYKDERTLSAIRAIRRCVERLEGED